MYISHISDIFSKRLRKPTVFFSQKGSWEIIIESSKIVLGARDTISVPTNMDISIQIDEKDEGQLNCVTQI